MRGRGGRRLSSWKGSNGSSTAGTIRRASPFWERRSLSSSAKGGWRRSLPKRKNFRGGSASRIPAGRRTGSRASATLIRTVTAAWRSCTTASSRTPLTFAPNVRRVGKSSLPKRTAKSSPTSSRQRIGAICCRRCKRRCGGSRAPMRSPCSRKESASSSRRGGRARSSWGGERGVFLRAIFLRSPRLRTKCIRSRRAGLRSSPRMTCASSTKNCVNGRENPSHSAKSRGMVERAAIRTICAKKLPKIPPRSQIPSLI